MEVEAWSGRGHLGLCPPYQNHTQSGEIGEEDILLEYFPCPFCYIEVEVPFLWSHLEEEHCFDFKNAVCPMCADNPARDMISHFTMQHSHLLKRRKSHRSSSWSQNSSPVYEVDSFREMSPNQGRFGAEPAPDPLLLQFICNAAPPTNAESGKVNHTMEVPSVPSHEKRSAATAVETLGQEDLEERLQRIEFIREMLVSTIF